MKLSKNIIDTGMEDNILTGLIISNKFISLLQSHNIKDLWQGSYHKIISHWCFDYFSEFKKTPGLHIQDIFEEEKERSQISEEIQENVSLFLYRLSQKYENTKQIDINFLIKQTQDYFNNQNQILLKQDISDALLEKTNPKEINEIIQSYKSFDFQTTPFYNSIITSNDLLKEKVKPLKAIVYPWLRENSLNMIFAQRGLGKSFLALILGIAITRINYDEINIGPWYVKNPCGVLLIDGEMGKFDLQDRIKRLSGPLQSESKRFPLTIFSSPDYTADEQESVNLYTLFWQQRVFDYLKTHRSTRVLILDNLSSLCAGREENDNTGTSVFNSWLISLRALGISVILIHHAGKGGTQRGASSLEDPLNNIIVLKKPADWVPGDGAHFSISFEKARNDPGGKDWQPFALRIMDHDDNNKWSTWCQV